MQNIKMNWVACHSWEHCTYVRADWDMLASENNIDIYADSVSEFIRKCIVDVVPTVTIKTYPNQTPWIDGSIRA
jgi:hypothetical protein